MKTWMKVSLFVAAVVGHLALTLLNVFRSIDCGIISGCITTWDRLWSQILGFPIFSALELFDRATPGNHSSGTMLMILIPLNSIIVVTIIFFFVSKIFRKRAVLKSNLSS
jgi:hypothetical protein